MTDFNEVKSKITSIQYSRYLGASTLVAMGSNISIGVGIHLFMGPILKTIGYRTPTAYVLTFIFFLPIILTLAERTPLIHGAGGMYDLARARKNVRSGFLNGWMLLGGLVGLGALLAFGAAQYINYLLAQLFQTSVPSWLLTIILVLLIAVNQFFGTYAEWRKRRLIVWGSVIFVLFLLALAVVKPQPAMMGYAWLPTYDEIQAVPFLAIGLWGIYFILERSDQLRASRQNMLSSLLAPIVILAGFGMITAVILLKYPLLIVSSDAPLLALASTYHPLYELVLVVLVSLMMLTGLNQLFTSLFLLTQEMAADGLLPPVLVAVQGKGVPERVLLLATGLILATAVFFPVNVIASIASVCLLAALAVIHSPGITKKAAQLPEDRWLKLPFHPLFPIVVVILCLTLIFLQPLDNLFWSILWLLVGVVFYILYARQATIAKRQKEVLVSELETVRAKVSYRVMVNISRPETAVSLIKAGIAVARGQKGSDLLVLHVLEAPEQTPDKKQLAQTALQALEKEVQQAAVADIAVTPLIRIAPSVSAGILSTAWEENVNAILLGWPQAKDTPPAVAQEGLIDMIVRKAAQEVLVLHGELPDAIHTVLVPMTSESHEVAALSLGQALKQSETDTVMAIQPVRERLTDEVESSFNHHLQKEIDKLADREGVSGQVLQIANNQDAFTKASEQYDLMIIGMSGEGYLSTTTFSGGSVELAESAASPTILVKSAEKQERFLVRRAWEELINWLPAVDTRQQAVVYLGMRRDAKATIDYYVLMLLATTIAYLGLLLNSGAVIIGAMLIAPLMSPILAMAHGIVQGNSKLLRQAANTTFNGVLVSVGTAVIFTFGLTAVSFPIPATTEILSRTSPNILDMMVALASGAAAAYAVSRKEVASALPGVAIAAALVPPLAVAGYGLGSIQFEYAAGALLLFITNLAAIVLAGAITFLALGFRPPIRAERGEQTKSGLRMAGVAMVIISIPLLLTTVVSNKQATDTAAVETIIVNYWPPSDANVQNVSVSWKRSNFTANFELYDFTQEIDTDDMLALQQEVEEAVGEAVVLQAIIIDSQLDVINDSTQPLPTQTPTPRIDLTRVLPETAEPVATETAVFPTSASTPTATPRP